jgi:signal transduction histidine kinase/CheY-like chemotaxis protein
MKDLRAWRASRWKWATEVVVVAVLYFAAASLSLRLAFEKTNASPVWPPSGIALVAVLLLGYRVWPGILLGAFFANVATFLANQAAGVLATVTVSAVIAAGNTLEAVVGRYLLDRSVGARNPFARASDVLKFTAVPLLACLVSASIGPTAVALAGIAPSAGYGTISFTWWLGDAAGVLLVAPLVLTWSAQPQLRWARHKAAEAAVLFLSLFVVMHVGFGGWLLGPDAHYPLTFVPLPWLVWSAFRFGPREAATAAAVTSGIAVWDTVSGLGPFVQGTINESLLLVQGFVGLVTVTFLTMAALVTERRGAQATLQKAHDTLETRVALRTSELVRVNDTLQAEIAERKQAEAERTKLETQLSQTQKLEAIGRLAAGVAHDFNNLLTVIRGRNQLVLRRLPPADPLCRDLELIEKTCDRAASVVEQLLAFSRKQVLRPTVLNLNVVVAGMLDMLRRLIGEDIELAFVAAPKLGRVRADVGRLEQVIVNLAVNARDAMPDGGRLTIETANVDLDEEYAGRHVSVRPGAYVRLSVSDTGVGMEEKVRVHLFDPFFTTKQVGKGSGLGLATVYGIVKQSGGNIWVYSEVGHGATFKIYLPQVQESADTPAERRAAKPTRGGAETVLLVEDEDEVRDLTREVLEGLGYTVLEARLPGEAVRISEQHLGPIHLLLTDVVMPELNGRQLARRLTSGRADMKVLYMSGYTDDAIARHGVLEPGTRFLEKPFSREMVADKIREVLDETPER